MTGLNPDQFSAAELPVYQGGVNTGTNWGENTMVSPEIPSGGNQQSFDLSGGNNRRRKKDKEDSLVPSLLSVPSMAASAAGALSLNKVSDNVLSGAGNFIKSGVGSVVGAGENFLGQATKAIGGGLEDLTIAAKTGGNLLSEGVGAVGRGLGTVGKGIGSVVDAIEPSGGFLGDVPENLGKGLGTVGRGLGSAWDAIEPSGGFIGDIPETIGKGLSAAAKSDVGRGIGQAALEGYNWTMDRVGDTPHWLKDRVEDAPGWIGNQFKDFYNDYLSPDSIKNKPGIPLPGVEAPVPVPVP